MSRLEKIIVACIVIVLFLFGRSLMLNSQYQGFISDPVQVNLTNYQEVFIPGKEGEVKATLVAEYTIEAVVKGTQKYSDYPSQIASRDFILAWGELNKKEVGKYIKYSQSGRWYYYRYFEGLPVSVDYIGGHSANVHIIHKDEEVLNEIKKIDKGDHVILHGYLVNVNFKDGPWNSSLSRNDTGNGACEIMYVTSVER